MATPSIIRSFLFVPGDSPRKLEKSLTAGADALILDLEDSVLPTAKPIARKTVAEFLAARRHAAAPSCWVRVNPLSSPDALIDLAYVMAAAPDGIILPKLNGPAELLRMCHYLDAFEAQHGLAARSTRILPVATETPASLFELGNYTGVTPRLFGLTWGAEDLATSLRAATNREPDGTLAFTYQLARALCLAGARAAGVTPVETAFLSIQDPAATFVVASRARQDGFFGMLAIHPNQIDPINRAFTPTQAELERAAQIIEAFTAAEGAGAIQFEGAMLDIPHLRQAEQILHVASLLAARTGAA